MILEITENGERKIYNTNATFKKISDAFEASDSVEELRAILSEDDFTLIEYNSGLELNFDNK